MNELEDQLRSGQPTLPRRPLRTDFTTTITQHISEHPRRPRTLSARLQEIITMRFLHKPALALGAFIAAITIGGSAYAAMTGWPGVSTLFQGQHDLPGGDRIVKVEAKGCSEAHMQSSFLSAKIPKEADVYYYRIHHASQLTNQQITHMVQGECELSKQTQFSTEVVYPELSKNPLNKDRTVGHYIDSIVKAFDGKSITLESLWPKGTSEGLEVEKVTETFPHITNDVLVYSLDQQISLRDIKVGDHISIKYRTIDPHGPLQSEILPGMLDTNTVTIVSMTKNPPNVAAALDYWKYHHKEFTEVIPCDKQPSGYCTFEEYQQ